MSDLGEPSAEAVAAGLDDAKSTIAEMWRRMDDADNRARCMRALRAVVEAERTMQRADAFLLAKGRAERQATFDDLRIACILRVGHAVRGKP